MSIGIDFVLRANSAAFTRGLAAANNAIKDTKKGLRDFDVGFGVKSLLGIGGIISGFRLAITHAQELRDEMEKVGRPVSDNVASVARYGDAIDELTGKVKMLAVDSLAFFTKAGEAWGSLINYARGYSFEQQKINEDSEKAAKLAEKNLDEVKRREPERRKAAEKRLASAEEAASPEAKRQRETSEAAKIQEELKGVTKGSTREIELKGRYQELVNSFAEAENKDTETEQRALKERNDKAEKERRSMLNKVAPTVEELAAQETGGFTAADDPRLRARRTLELEQRARTYGERGDIKKALELQGQAEGLRKGLEGSSATTSTLTPDTAKTAFQDALKDTNTKLDDLEKALAGIIKAQK